MKRAFLSIVIAVVAMFCVGLVPIHNAQAVDWFPIVPCGLNAQPKNATRMDTDSSGKQVPHDYTQPCNQCLLIELGKNGIDFTLYGIVPMVGTLMFLWAGFQILWGGKNGDPGAVKKGREKMLQTAIGIAILLGAWMITNFVLRTIARPDLAATPWYSIQCRVDTLKNLVDASVPSVGTTTKYTCNSNNQCVQSTSGEYTDSTCNQKCAPAPAGQCLFSGINLCDGRNVTPYSKQTMQCTASGCSNYASAVNQYANGAASANLLKAIMVKESSCNASADSGSAYGLMQIQPSTANIYKSRCGISETVTSTWLKQNPKLSVCIAAAYINAISQSSCGSSVRNLAAGYNGGTGACANSVSCAGQTSCDGSPVKKWECLYDDTNQQTCNAGYNETRDYALKVSFCASAPGF
jgi:hypothetical protein